MSYLGTREGEIELKGFGVIFHASPPTPLLHEREQRSVKDQVFRSAQPVPPGLKDCLSKTPEQFSHVFKCVPGRKKNVGIFLSSLPVFC